MDINISNVTKIEFSRDFPSNGGCRTIRVTTTDWRDQIEVHEITVFGKTESVCRLPQSLDFDCVSEARTKAAADAMTARKSGNVSTQEKR